MKDLTPKDDVKAGTLGGGDYGSGKINIGNGHHLKTPPLTNVLQMLQIMAIVGFAFAWWAKRESKSDVTDTSHTIAIEEHGRRLDAEDKRLDEIQKGVTQNYNDLHELMTKFRIMVELVDGNKQNPELHK